jgi:hypothetical protein
MLGAVELLAYAAADATLLPAPHPLGQERLQRARASRVFQVFSNQRLWQGQRVNGMVADWTTTGCQFFV